MRIAHLYPDLLNLYGDRGNIMCLQYRCRQRGIQVTVDEISVGDPFDHTKYDLLFIGGGQDFEQEVLLEDLHRGKDEEIRRAVADGTVVLAICGGYQMLGKYYQTYTGERLDYIGAVDFYTVGEKERLIGNYAFDTEFGRMIGFENHSGRTYLGKGVAPLGKMVSGYGNNGRDGTEGVHYKNTFCTYSHGPVLPKNPALADKLIETAMRRRDPSFVLTPLDDSAEDFARDQVERLYIHQQSGKKHKK